MDLIKEFNIDVDLLIDKTKEVKESIKELENSQEQSALLQFEFDTYMKYLDIHLREENSL